MAIPEHTNPSRERRASAPYNFIPVPDVIVPAQDLPPRDRYHAGRHTGAFHCKLTTKTPLYTRAALEPGDDVREVKDKSDFFYVDPETKRPVIPGSSLRGVLRSLVEVITYSKLQPVTDRWLFFRTMDGSSVMNAYQNRVGLRPQDNRIRGGIFYTDGENHSIQPCLVARVPYDEDGFTIFGENVWTGSGPNRRPNWALQYRDVWFKYHPEALKNIYHFRPVVAIKDTSTQEKGFVKGVLVITGWAPKKKGEFAFVKTSASPIKVLDEFVRNFETEGQISQWQEKAFPLKKPPGANRRLPGGLRNGEPVFYMQDKKSGVIILGRASKFRIPYLHTPREMLPAYADENGAPLLLPDLVDMTEAMFGRVDEVAKHLPQIAGRVFVGDAHVPGQEPFTSWDEPPRRHRLKILNSPKPTAVQHYLTQDQPDSEKTLHHYDDDPSETILRGQKFYWHKRPDLQQSDWSEERDQSKSNLYTGPVRPVAAGVTFEFDFWFENLTDEELGALLWMLRMASHEAYGIKLGLGKPYGLGTVQLSYELQVDDRAQRYRTLGQTESGWTLPGREVDEASLMRAFEGRILRYLGKQRGDARCLSQVERIQEFLRMMLWPGPDPTQTAYMDLDRFRERPALPRPSGVATARPPVILEPVTREQILAALPWRVGVVRQSPQGRKRGRLETLPEKGETETFSFSIHDVLTSGYTPGKKHKVLFKAGNDIDGSPIILVRKK